MATSGDEGDFRSPPNAERTVEDRLEEQAREIKRLTESLTLFMDRDRGAAPAVSQIRHAQRADNPVLQAHEEDLLSVLADPDGLDSISVVNEAVDLIPAVYDPTDIDSLTPREQDNSYLFDVPADEFDIYNADQDIGASTFDKLADFMTKAVTLPPKKESLDKIAAKYLTPANAPAACTPKVEAEIWATLPRRARSLDAQSQKLQQNIVKAFLPYAEILATLHTASTEGKPVDVKRLKQLAFDGIALGGFASYEMSMFRRLGLKPFLNPKYRGLCSRSTPLDAKLFGKDLQSTLKNVAEAFNVGQRVSSLGKAPRRPGQRQRPTPYQSSRRPDRPFRQWNRPRGQIPATLSRAPSSPRRQTGSDRRHDSGHSAPSKN